MALAAATIEEGVLGLEGQHQWGSMVTLGVPGVPRYKIDRIIGLHSLPEADDHRESAQARMGEVVYPALARGKTVTYEGRTQAASLPSLRTAEGDLKGAFSERSAPGVMYVRPPAARGGVGWLYKARPLSLEIDDEQVRPQTAPLPWQREFILSLRQHDPRYYTETLSSVMGTADGVGMTATNYGNAPGEPQINLNGPAAADVYVDWIDAGGNVIRRLHFEDLPLLTGNQMYLSFENRTGFFYTGVNGLLYLNDDDSDWWDEGVPGLVPLGQTFIRVSGVPTYDVFWRSASW